MPKVIVHFDTLIGNLHPGLPIKLKLIQNVKDAYLDGILPLGLSFHQEGFIIGSPNFSEDGKIFNFDICYTYDNIKNTKNFSLSINSNKRHSFLLVLPTGYESAEKSPFHR